MLWGPPETLRGLVSGFGKEIEFPVWYFLSFRDGTEPSQGWCGGFVGEIEYAVWVRSVIPGPDGILARVGIL